MAQRAPGKTFRQAGSSGVLNGTAWCVPVHFAQRQLMFVAARQGQLFRNEDAGRMWITLRREFGEVRALILRRLERNQD